MSNNRLHHLTFKKAFMLSIILVAALGVADFVFPLTRYTYLHGNLLPEPFFLGQVGGTPKEWVAQLIANEGGLPKVQPQQRVSLLYVAPDAAWSNEKGVVLASRMDLTPHPIASWVIEQIALGDFTGQRAATSEGYTAEYRFLVVYGDGDVARFRWDYWAFGNTIGPIAWFRGNRGGVGSLLRIE